MSSTRYYSKKKAAVVPGDVKYLTVREGRNVYRIPVQMLQDGRHTVSRGQGLNMDAKKAMESPDGNWVMKSDGFVQDEHKRTQSLRLRNEAVSQLFEGGREGTDRRPVYHSTLPRQRSEGPPKVTYMPPVRSVSVPVRPPSPTPTISQFLAEEDSSQSLTSSEEGRQKANQLNHGVNHYSKRVYTRRKQGTGLQSDAMGKHTASTSHSTSTVGRQTVNAGQSTNVMARDMPQRQGETSDTVRRRVDDSTERRKPRPDSVYTGEVVRVQVPSYDTGHMTEGQVAYQVYPDHKQVSATPQKPFSIQAEMHATETDVTHHKEERNHSVTKSQAVQADGRASERKYTDINDNLVAGEEDTRTVKKRCVD